MHKHGKVDLNQTAIVNCLRDVGASVEITSDLGGGFPDLVVGYAGKTFLMEVKTETGKLTKHQIKFNSEWKGSSVYVVRSEFEAVKIITGDHK